MIANEVERAISEPNNCLGLHVIATARRLSVITDLAELGMSTVQLDVTDPVSIEKCHKTVQEITGGHLDILLNNA